MGQVHGRVEQSLKILCYPNEILRRQAEKVTAFDASLRETARQMLAVMDEAKGVGLAANQVGLAIRLCVFRVPESPGNDIAMVNPEIVERLGSDSSEEGCLSFPGIFIDVARATQLKVRYQDLEGQEHTAEVAGLMARAVQHEIDHLDGVLLVDKMNAVQRVAKRGALRMLEARQERSQAAEGTP